MQNIIKTSTTTSKFRKLKIGESLIIECDDRTAPHSFAKQAGIKVRTWLAESQPKKGYRVNVKRTQ